MSLKLDELRKRLLQQQTGAENGSREGFGGKNGEPANGGFEPRLVVNRPAAPPAKAGANGDVATTATALTPSPEDSLLTADSSGVTEESLAPDSAAPESTPASANDAGLDETLAALAAAPEAGAADAVSPVADASALGDAVAKVFERTRSLRTLLEDLSMAFEPIERMGEAAVEAFAPLHGFHRQMAQLARSFAPMRGLRSELADLAQTFGPMRELRNQMEYLAAAFESHLADLVGALEPARLIRERLEHLALAFDQADELQRRFGELRAMFTIEGEGGAASRSESEE